MSNRRCPRCQASYAPPARYCVKDGTPLVEIAPPAARNSRTPVFPVGFAAADTSGAATLTGRTLDGRYRVTRRLGEGGMSYVYHAEDIGDLAAYAVKVLLPRLARDPASVERLRREATIAMQLDHPNVCSILRFGQTPDGIVYLVMPFLAGEPLSEHEGRRGPYPVAGGIALLVQICHGLQHAHDLGIVHRDLKPENVMLVPDVGAPDGFRAVVMDFGLAKERRAGTEVVKLTQTGIILGTPEFMSPEQIRGKPLDGRSDVYALAILAYEMFTGQLPFVGKNAQDLMLARLKGHPTPIRSVRNDLPARLEAVIMRALSMQATERFGSMTEFGDALQAASGVGVFARLFGR